MDPIVALLETHDFISYQEKGGTAGQPEDGNTFPRFAVKTPTDNKTIIAPNLV